MKVRNSRFANYVTNLAFNLSLSKGMVVQMAMIGNGTTRSASVNPYWAVGAPDNFIAAKRALEDRGLIYAPNPAAPGIMQFTEAGKCVFELLKMSGLIEQVQNACNDYTDKKKKA